MAPKLINSICNKIETKSLAEVEWLAAKLATYSRKAQLTSFADKAKNLIIAAREQEIDLAKKHADSLRYSFEQMAKAIHATEFDKRTEVEDSRVRRHFSAIN